MVEAYFMMKPVVKLNNFRGILQAETL